MRALMSHLHHPAPSRKKRRHSIVQSSNGDLRIKVCEFMGIARAARILPRQIVAGQER
jgi:hypothetical protein